MDTKDATRGGRDGRIELRATSEEKRLLAAAAAYERLDLTSFIMRNVLPAARDVVEPGGTYRVVRARYPTGVGIA